MSDDRCNVIEIDFRDTPDVEVRLDELDGKLDDLERQTLEALRNVRVAELEREKWERWKRARLSRLIGNLRQQLADERRATRFSDEQVLEAFHSVAAVEPVHARIVARELFPGEPSHSATIRVGQALGRLADAGRITRIRARNNHETNRWQAHPEGPSEAGRLVPMPLAGSAQQGEDAVQVHASVALAHVRALLRLLDEEDEAETAAAPPKLSVVPSGLEAPGEGPRSA